MKALDPSRRAPSRPGTDDDLALGAQLVGQTLDQGQLGTDHEEVGVELGGGRRRRR